MNPPEVLTWKKGASTFYATPTLGARLMRWNIALAGPAREVFYWPRNADWSQPAKIRGGNPILFPFVARTFFQGKENCWKDPSGKIRPMPRHGFARESAFEMVEKNSDGFLAKLIHSDTAREAYPFEYTFCVRYRFEELSFSVELILENHDTLAIPWCAGHHFYFSLPWNAGLTQGDYAVRLNAKKAFRHSINGELVKLEPVSLEYDCDDIVIIDRLSSHCKEPIAHLGPKSGEQDITVRMPCSGKTPSWLTFTTWTESKESPFFCLEPWMGLPNALEHKQGLHFVEPGETGRFFIEVNV
jgi:galactose mutarotase-like enzyme